jgi:hypothetical protein
VQAKNEIITKLFQKKKITYELIWLLDILDPVALNFLQTHWFYILTNVH